MNGFKDTNDSEYLKQYCNWNGLRSICLTFDMDFAPDYMISHVIRILQEYNVKATFFATHDSEVLRWIAMQKQYEVGLHPNLSNNSSQGKNINEIISGLKSVFPNAVGNRFHLLNYSYRDLIYLSSEFIKYDVSILKFNCPYLIPCYHRDLNMVLLTYSWEDGICENAKMPMSVSSIDIDSPGLKIFNFHPLNIYINGPDRNARLELLNGTRQLTIYPQQQADKYRCHGVEGAEQVLTDLLELMKRTKCKSYKLREII